nr:LLM class flavin-dependent oxidoreductase [Bradyrhizobium cosmicum]
MGCRSAAAASSSATFRSGPTGTLDYNTSLAGEAEGLGFEYELAPARFVASHGWELQQGAITCTAVLSAHTKRLKLISAIHTGFWHPAMIAESGGHDRRLFEGAVRDQHSHRMVQG